ncbi:FliA/WhiG family RNA polymerase sigma factor [Fodinisporobacter ferrooxydans]|uniref:FliA/WhiG family RNA polymerase sigma factor n=1 Tax=Fodinisporobacter ferrooxydans TaxID=2901836 RepID=A0ABY4CG88_9BACL|nr:FliA/WhiG family RNA polymerase sigma factor [Alicyclobacillaceae bacterium MYW30-H2]
MDANALQNFWHNWKQQKCMLSMDELFREFRPFVIRIVHALHIQETAVLSREDLISAGFIGLLNAFDRYDTTMAVRFETYAYFRVRGAILDELRKLDPAPRSLRRKLRSIQDAYEIVEKELGRSASDDEIASFLDMTVGELHRTLQESQALQISSLDASVAEDENDVRSDLVSDPDSPNPLEIITRSEAEQALLQVIERLPEKERLVVTLYYYEELTFKEISEILDVTVSRISQLHTKATYRLRGALSRKKKEWFN